MKKIIYIIWLMLLPSLSFPAEQNVVSKNNEFGGETIVSTFKPDEHSMLSKKIDYRDKNNVVRKSEVIFNQKTVDESGIARQVEFYNGKFADKYEIIFSNTYISKAGIDRSIEYMAAEDKILRTDYFYRGKLLYSENDTSYSRGYNPALIGYYNAMLLANYSKYKIKQKDVFVHEASVFKLKSIVTYRGQVTALDDKDSFILAGFCKMLGKPEVVKLYNRKVMVEENGVKYWVMIQDKVLEHLQKVNPKTRMLLLFYYIGGYNDRLLLAGIDYIEL